MIEGLPERVRPLRTLDVELKRKRRRLYAGSALIGVVAAAVAIPVFALGQGSGKAGEVAPNSVAVIDPETNRVIGYVPVGVRPAEIVSGSGSVWVANLDDETVSRIDPKTRELGAHDAVLEYPGDMASPGARPGLPGVPRVRRIAPGRNEAVNTRADHRAGILGDVGPSGAWLAAGAGACGSRAATAGSLATLEGRERQTARRTRIDEALVSSSPAAVTSPGWRRPRVRVGHGARSERGTPDRARTSTTSAR